MTSVFQLSLPLLRQIATRRLAVYLKRNCSKAIQKEPWHFKGLSPFGKVQVSAGQDSIHVIQPIEPVQYPNQDEAFVRSNRPEGVRCESSDSLIFIKDDGLSSDGLICEYKVPIKFGIEATLRESAGIQIQDMESGQIRVQTEDGSCFLKSIKSDNLLIQTSGSFLSQCTLHCNGEILAAQSGKISIHKALGTSLYLCTDCGDVSVDSLYVEKCTVKTQSGNVRLGATHRQVKVSIEEKGDLTIGTLDGSLVGQVNSGNVKLHITQLEHCEIDVTEGDVEVQLTDSLSAQIDIEAPSVSMDARLNTSQVEELHSTHGVKYKGCVESTSKSDETEKAGTLKIRCGKGKVTVQCQDWFSSLGLGEPA